MSKKLFFSFILVFSFLTVYSQVQFGIKAGANYSTNFFGKSSAIDGEKLANPDYRLGYHFGMIVNFPISNNMSFNTELLFSDKGAKEYDIISETNTLQHLYYINLPLIFGYNLFDNITLQLGIEPEYLLAENNFSHHGLFLYNRFDLGLLGGIEYNYDRFILGARYTQGITPLYDLELRNQDGNTIGETTNFNRCFQVYIGYKVSGVK